jgi:hypothetical protein
MKRKKINWKKIKKNAIKSFGKSQKWVETHVNPDLLSGNEDRIFAPQGFGDMEQPEGFGFGFEEPRRRKRRR